MDSQPLSTASTHRIRRRPQEQFLAGSTGSHFVTPRLAGWEMRGVRGNGWLSNLKRERSGLSNHIGLLQADRHGHYVQDEYIRQAIMVPCCNNRISWQADDMPAWAALPSSSKPLCVGVLHQGHSFPGPIVVDPPL